MNLSETDQEVFNFKVDYYTKALRAAKYRSQRARYERKLKELINHHYT